MQAALLCFWISVVHRFGDRQGTFREMRDVAAATGSRAPDLTVFSCVSLEMVHFANNWVRSLQPFNVNIRVYALDAGVCENIPHGAVCVQPDDARQVEDKQAEMHTDVVYQGKNYLRNVNRKLPVFVDALRAVPKGSWVLFSDVDSVFLRSPVEYLRSQMPETASLLFQQGLTTCRDFPGLTQVSGDADVCTGMFYARADDVSISVLHGAIGSPTSDGTDQGMVNYRLRTSHVPIKLLPCALFPNGYVFKHQRPQNPIVVHFNYIVKASDKVIAMKAAHMWMVPL